jgi:hypothetical protein
VLDIVVHKHVRLSEVTVSAILDSDHPPVAFYFLDHVRTRNTYILDPVNKFTDWERFHSLAPELISPRIQISSGEEVDKAARDCTASVALAYRLSTRKITLSYLNKYLPGIKSLLKHRRRLRILWQVTRDPACKTALNWVAKTIRRMTGRKALERWETKVGNCEVTPQALLLIPKSLMKRDGPKAPTALHGPLGIIYHPNEEASVIADCSENQFTYHDHYGEKMSDGWRLLTSVDDTPLGKLRPCDMHKLVN